MLLDKQPETCMEPNTEHALSVREVFFYNSYILKLLLIYFASGQHLPCQTREQSVCSSENREQRIENVQYIKV